MERKVEILSNKEALISRSLDLIVEKLQQAVQARGEATIALSGGSTPKPLYQALAQQPLPWSQIHVFWGDERYVPNEHPDSNQRMARHAWLDQVDIPAQNLYPMPTRAGDAKVDAQTYENKLAKFFRVAAGDFPAFDVILLGLGDDGHTASLFPQTPALQVCDRLITVGEKDGQPRLTFTVPLINHGRCVIFLVAGAGKKPALAEIFAVNSDPQIYPARFVHPQGELFWLLDESAGDALIINS